VKAGLLGFRHPTHCDKNWPIRPNRRVREGLILSEEANIERILLSLALKSTTQSVIVGKLSAYRRKNRLRRALWELDSIIRTEPSALSRFPAASGLAHRAVRG
jgi:TnpA family transposase